MRAITLTAAVLLAGGAAVRAQTPAASVAVLPFEDGGSCSQDDDTYAGLQVALPVLIGARLRGSAGVRMVGDDTARAVLAAQDLGEHRGSMRSRPRIGRRGRWVRSAVTQMLAHARPVPPAPYRHPTMAAPGAAAQARCDISTERHLQAGVGPSSWP